MKFKHIYVHQVMSYKDIIIMLKHSIRAPRFKSLYLLIIDNSTLQLISCMYVPA